MLFPLDVPLPDHGPVLSLPDLVVFDLVGVLVPERPRLASCLAAALAAADIPVEDDDLAELITQPIRPGISRLVSRRLRLAPEVSRPLVKVIAEDFNERVLQSLQTFPHIKLQPGAEILLNELAADGIHIGIDSELDGALATALIRRAGWAGTGLLEAVVGSDEVLAPRPGPGQIEEIRRRCGLQADAKVVKVVGTPSDAQAALAARCTTVYSLSPEPIVGPTAVADLGDLAERILARDLI
jgi:phosphoglycolate phosphatase-like HAD superfamily hydrolase